MKLTFGKAILFAVLGALCLAIVLWASGMFKIRIPETKEDLLKGNFFFSPAQFSEIATTGSMVINGDVRVLSTTTDRAYALFCNDESTNAMYIGFNKDTPMTKDKKGIKLEAGECYEINRNNLYTGSVRATSTTATDTLTITEGTF